MQKFLLSIALAILCSFAPTKPQGYKVGDYATDFKLKNVDGKMVALADYKDAKGFIISFTCNHCPYSKYYEQRIIDLHNKFASKGFPVIAINPNDPTREPDDSFEKMQQLAKEKKYPFAYLVDQTQEVAKAYGATNTPHNFLIIKENGKYKVAYIGAIDDNAKDGAAATKHYIEDAVNQVLSGKPIQTEMTKAIGCSIKWKS